MNIVLDTNIALNLWFFKDATTCARLSPLLASAQVYGTPAMLTELVRVARSPHLARYISHTAQTDAVDELAAAWRLAVICVEPDAAQRSPLRCRDLDDQMFLDCAQQTAASMIVTLDKDLLKLKKQAQKINLLIAPF